MTGADMGMMPMASPARRRMARALVQPAGGMPMMVGDQTPGAVRPRNAGETDLPPNFGGGEGSAGLGAQHGRAFSEMTNDELGDYANRSQNGNWAERNMANLASLAGPLGSAFGLNALENSQLDAEKNARGMDLVGSGVQGIGIGAGPLSPELQGRGGLPGLDLSPEALDAAAAAGAMADPTMGGMSMGANGEGVDPGGFAGGGVVMPGDLAGPDPLGPDQGFAALQAGEVVLNKDQQKRLGRDKIARALMGRK